MYIVFFFFASLAASASVSSYVPLSGNCPCGYYIPETNLILTSRSTLDPSLFPSNTKQSQLQDLINAQGYQIDYYLLDNTPQKTNYTVNNVAYNANLKTLDLKVTGSKNPTKQIAIPSAEISSLVSSMRYGSFRYTTKMSSVPGACHGLFFYKSDSEEIDMEVTTRWLYGTNEPDDTGHYDGMQYTIQSKRGNFTTHPFDKYFDPTKAFHEYRFDWQDGKVVYYADGKVWSVQKGWAPGKGWANGVGGSALINNWADGDPGWTGVAPTQDNILSLKKLDVFYNSTDSAINKQFKSTCKAAKDKRLCIVA